MSAERPSLAQAPKNISVYLLARKRLLQNSRVFKQARSQARAGYSGALAPHRGLEHSLLALKELDGPV